MVPIHPPQFDFQLLMLIMANKVYYNQYRYDKIKIPTNTIYYRASCDNVITRSAAAKNSLGEDQIGGPVGWIRECIN